ncbi:hypothetical protein B0H14DRAFT_2586324 [Mycena olivaceomarginata]|nr:hypothetical protein B0H14DRAFT_2586324 [Mycena olivaceomarginata]
MVKTSNLIVALLAAGSVVARPVYTRDSGFDLSDLLGAAAGSDSGDSTGGFNSPQAQSNQQAAADAQASGNSAAATKASAAEAAAKIDISASIAAASSSAAAVAATQTVNPLDLFSLNTHGLTPEQLGQLSGLRAKLAIDTQFKDNGAIAQDNDDIEAPESINDGSGF